MRQYTEYEREVIELWQRGMTMIDIAAYLGISGAMVSTRVRKNFAREKALSKDGRSWFWRTTRKLDEDAPLSENDQRRKYARPDDSYWHFHSDDERNYVDWAQRLLNIMDDLNELTEWVVERCGYRVVVVERDDGFFFGTLLPARNEDDEE